MHIQISLYHNHNQDRQCSLVGMRVCGFNLNLDLLYSMFIASRFLDANFRFLVGATARYLMARNKKRKRIAVLFERLKCACSLGLNMITYLVAIPTLCSGRSWIHSIANF